LPPSLEAEKVKREGCVSRFSTARTRRFIEMKNHVYSYRKTAMAVTLAALVSACPAPLAFAQNASANSFPARNTGGGTGSGPSTSNAAHDPGPRAGTIGSGQPLAGLTGDDLEYFQNGLARFAQTDSVSGTIGGEPGVGLGPGYNLNSCQGCHAQPAPGGSSPSANAFPNIGANPQVEVATADGALNTLPSFITADGPVREVRFPFLMNANGTVSTTADGGVHDVFTIDGRPDAAGCSMAQPNFALMAQLNNMIFRIPTPIFGGGLIENIPDATIVANMNANPALKRALGISGHTNNSGNDGSITRFGWKAQNKSLEIFAGEAYNVEMGVTNELFQTKRASPPAACLYNPTPEDETNFSQSGAQIPSDTVAFAAFMRFLAPPVPSAQGIAGNPSAASIADGRVMFSLVHCDMCHTATLQTGKSAMAPALNNQTTALYSDLLVHNMGSGLADRVSQGSAGPDEFRTAPLWGLGQRAFFLHDGRATPANGGLLQAIEAHASQGSEANSVISLFNNQLSNQQKQDLLNFLRTL
jgi:CxxC motif-containing protein (DUF1111 family)